MLINLKLNCGVKSTILGERFPNTKGLGKKY